MLSRDQRGDLRIERRLEVLTRELGGNRGRPGGSGKDPGQYAPPRPAVLAQRDDHRQQSSDRDEHDRRVDHQRVQRQAVYRLGHVDPLHLWAG